MDPGLSLDYVTTVLAALLAGTGFVLQQHAAAMQPASRFLSIRLIIDLFRKPRWLAGIALLAGGATSLPPGRSAILSCRWQSRC